MAQDLPQNPLTQTELTVVVQGETYVFKIPSARDNARIGSEARFLRAQDDPAGVGAAEGLDIETFAFYQALATIKVLLKKTSTGRLFSPDAAGLPVVDVDNIPNDVPVHEVFEGFLQALGAFREGNAGAERPAQSTPVEGVAHPE
jgi:hypothetical protein